MPNVKIGDQMVGGENVSTSSEVATRESARPVPVTDPGTGVSTVFEAQADIVVVGGGGGGLPAALFDRWLGEEVILLEKAAELGGTARKAAFWYWVPNNAAMQAAGTPDGEDDFLRYVARLSRPHQYDPGSPTLGQSSGGTPRGAAAGLRRWCAAGPASLPVP
jgi:hypothetical protein